MCEFPIALLIKQTLRSVVFDSTNMGIMSSRAQHFQSKTNPNTTQTSIETAFCSLLRSPESIKWLFERPNDYMYKIFENEAFKDAIDTAKSETELKVVKHRILYGFLKELRDSRPPQAMEWIAFQHYMYFVYRNFLTPKPIASNEALPNILVKKMYELIIRSQFEEVDYEIYENKRKQYNLNLTFEDKTQFYVRIITLLREYVMSALDNYEEISATADTTTYLKCLLSYYSAFCSAANKLSTVLSEFDQFMNDKFNINWYCLNQRMFFQYFFMVVSVQCKVPSFNKLVDANKPCNRELIKSYNAFIEDMSVLGRHWDLQRQRISVMSGRNTKEESQWLQKDWKMFEEITKIMKTNFWIIRNNEWKTTQETDDLDGHFLAIVEDTWHVADRLIAPEGNCICEDCMTAEFQQDLITGSVQQPFGSSKLVMCYICHDALSLEILGSHIVSKHSDLTIPRADLTKSYKWQISSPSLKKAFPVKRPSTKLCKVLSETMELAKNKEAQLFKVNDGTFKMKTDPDSNKEPITKRLLECPVRNGQDPVLKFNENGIKFPAIPGIKIPTEPLINLNCSSPNDLSKMNTKSHKEPIMKIASEPPVFAANNFSDEMEGCRAAFQEFVKSRTEGIDLQNRLSEKKEIKKPSLDKKDDCQVDAISNDTNLPWHLRRNQGNNTDTKVFDFLRNGNSPKPSPPATLVPSKPSDNGCAGHVCGHKCKKEDEVQTGGKKACQDTCDHHKEPKKCDCAYCEVFGSNVTAHSHKTNETRDRLRIRLSQRKEKINEYLKGSKNGANPKAVVSDRTQTPVINMKPPLGPKVSVTNNPNTKLTTNGSCTCSQNKTASCQNCVPINIKILSNSADAKTNIQTIAEVVEPKPKSTVVPVKSLTDLPDLSDIDGLLDFIQGNKPIDKIAMAQKKAAKKARQKLKKEQEKQRKEAEEEERRREEERIKEEKRREEERLRAQELARQQAEQMKKNKRNKIDNRLQQESTKSSKKKGKNKIQKDTELMEETIPAMVTIKRIVENNNSPPTVTITLKGSTPDQDKLLYTLVNGHTSEYLLNNNSENNIKSKKKNKNQTEQQNKANELNSEGKKKKKKITSLPDVSGSLITTKELKVTLAVDKSFHKGKEVAENIKKAKKQNSVQKSDKTPRNEQKRSETKVQSKPPLRDNVIDIPSLKLPPGITITKVNGPLTNKNSKSSTNSTQSSTPTQYQNVPVSKSGVIVVDTEKLIQQSITATSNKKNKKKKNRNKLSTDKSENENTSQMNIRNSSDSKPAMVTLKNPIFHTLQTKLVEKSEIPIIPYNEQASITQGENGMVTIRRPRCLQLPRDKESPMTEFLSELKPVIGPNVALSNRKLKDVEHKTYSLSNGHGAFLTNVNLENGICETPYTQNFTQNGVHIDLSNSFIHNVSDSNKSGLSAQDILWGLPGIEITKVNKNAINNDHDSKKSCQTADVSIIPTRTGINNGEKFNFDRDDWPFESVFAPKDILEDDLDADERELEAFKRFCQQSVPPLHKEKVAHLNVKDIILKKKNDVTYS